MCRFRTCTIKILTTTRKFHGARYIRIVSATCFIDGFRTAIFTTAYTSLDSVHSIFCQSTFFYFFYDFHNFNRFTFNTSPILFRGAFRECFFVALFLLLLPLFYALRFLAIDNPKIESILKLVQCLTVLPCRVCRLWLLRLFLATLLPHRFHVPATGARLARTLYNSHLPDIMINETSVFHSITNF